MAAWSESNGEVGPRPNIAIPFETSSQDGADVAFAVIDRVRNEMLHRVGLSDLLKPRINA
jgi:hypothetical protein